MIGFIVPFKPASETKNWTKDNGLLQQTIFCLLQQTNPNFRVIVVYTDLPTFEVADQRVRMIQFPFPKLSLEEVPHYKDLIKRFSSEKLVVRRWDKGRKLAYAAKIAKEEGCDFIMAVDSDDLISNKLVDFVETQKAKDDSKGWYIDKGYFYEEGSDYLIRQPAMMNAINGSTHILHSSLVSIPSFKEENWESYNLFTDHGWIRGRMKMEHNEELKPVPFYAVIYVTHGDNISAIKEHLKGNIVKRFLKNLLRKRHLDALTRKEFSINRS